MNSIWVFLCLFSLTVAQFSNFNLNQNFSDPSQDFPVFDSHSQLEEAPPDTFLNVPDTQHFQTKRAVKNNSTGSAVPPPSASVIKGEPFRPARQIGSSSSSNNSSSSSSSSIPSRPSSSSSSSNVRPSLVISSSSRNQTRPTNSNSQPGSNIGSSSQSGTNLRPSKQEGQVIVTREQRELPKVNRTLSAKIHGDNHREVRQVHSVRNATKSSDHLREVRAAGNATLPHLIARVARSPLTKVNSTRNSEEASSSSGESFFLRPASNSNANGDKPKIQRGAASPGGSHFGTHAASNAEEED